MEKTYDEWLREVDDLLEKEIGMTRRQLPLFPYQSYFNGGMSPRDVLFQFREWILETKVWI